MKAVDKGCASHGPEVYQVIEAIGLPAVLERVTPEQKNPE